MELVNQCLIRNSSLFVYQSSKETPLDILSAIHTIRTFNNAWDVSVVNDLVDNVVDDEVAN